MSVCSAGSRGYHPTWERSQWRPKDVRVEGHVITFGTYKHALESGETLVVFQALVHTWSRPTFVSVGAVGRMYAEGLIVSATGTVRRAPDEVMWTFR